MAVRWACALMVSGCVSVSYRGSAGVARTANTTSFLTEAQAGLDSRGAEDLGPHDSALFGYVGLGFRTSTSSKGFSAGAVITGGATYFRGRYGAVALATFGPEARSGRPSGDSGGAMVRLQLGVEVVAAGTDWGIHLRSQPCGYAGPGSVPNQHSHYIFGLLPGAEYHVNAPPGEAAAVSLLASFTEIWEPTC